MNSQDNTLKSLLGRTPDEIKSYVISTTKHVGTPALQAQLLSSLNTLEAAYYVQHSEETLAKFAQHHLKPPFFLYPLEVLLSQPQIDDRAMEYICAAFEGCAKIILRHLPIGGALSGRVQDAVDYNTNRREIGVDFMDFLTSRGDAILQEYGNICYCGFGDTEQYRGFAVGTYKKNPDFKLYEIEPYQFANIDVVFVTLTRLHYISQSKEYNNPNLMLKVSTFLEGLDEVVGWEKYETQKDIYEEAQRLTESLVRE